MTGARKKSNFGGANNDTMLESSIMDELSIVGFGGSRTLQGRIVARKDPSGKKKPVD